MILLGEMNSLIGSELFKIFSSDGTLKYFLGFFSIPSLSPVRKRTDHIISGSSSLTDATEMDFKTFHSDSLPTCSEGLIQRFIYTSFI